jgi:hypothetical protein
MIRIGDVQQLRWILEPIRITLGIGWVEAANQWPQAMCAFAALNAGRTTSVVRNASLSDNKKLLNRIRAKMMMFVSSR